MAARRVNQNFTQPGSVRLPISESSFQRVVDSLGIPPQNMKARFPDPDQCVYRYPDREGISSAVRQHATATRNRECQCRVRSDARNPNDWTNELHPTPGAFAKIATKFRTALQHTFPGRI